MHNTSPTVVKFISLRYGKPSRMVMPFSLSTKPTLPQWKPLMKMRTLSYGDGVEKISNKVGAADIPGDLLWQHRARPGKPTLSPSYACRIGW